MEQSQPLTPVREVPRSPEHCEQPMVESMVTGPLGRVKGWECKKCHAMILGTSVKEPKPYNAYNPGGR